MRRIFETLLLLICASGIAAASPAITGVYNSASWAPPGLTNGDIAQGSIFSVIGSELGPASPQQALTYPLPTSQGLGGTTVQVTVGTQGFDCIVIYASSTQVNVILPSRSLLGSGTLALTYQGNRITFAVKVVQSSFGMFTLNQGGSGPGVITDSAYQPKTPVNPAHPGDTLIGWGTGLGGVSGDETQPPPQVDLKSGVEVFVGGMAATVLYGGRGSSPGLDQINFVVPAGLSGCYVSVAVRVRGVIGNFTTLPIAPPGGICPDMFGFTAFDLPTLLKNGKLRTARMSFTRTPGSPDHARATFEQWDLPTYFQSRGLTGSDSSTGSCAVYEILSNSPVFSDPIQPPGLDAGASLTLAGPRGQQPLPMLSKGVYDAALGGGGGATPGFLDPGNYTVTNGSGGTDVGAVIAQFTQLPPISVAAPMLVVRGQDAPITWSGARGSDVVTIIGITSAQTAVGGQYPFVEFLCNADASAGQFTVPGLVTALLPLFGQSSQGGPGLLLQVSDTAMSSFTAPGIDRGYVYSRNVVSSLAIIQ